MQAGALRLAGNPDEALELVRTATRLKPQFPPFHLCALGLAKYCTESFQANAEALERADRDQPHDRWSYRLVLPVYGHLGGA